MERLDTLNKYFFGGEAEAEADIRNDIFVPPSNLKKILSFTRSRYKVLLGAKGVGKSLLINVLNESALEESAISVLLTPGDFNCEDIAKKATNSDKISAAYNQLLNAIGLKIGQYQSGLLTSSSEINLHKLAVDEGLNKSDAISEFSSFLTKVTPFAKDVAKAAMDVQRLNKNKNILSKDIATVLKKNQQKFWVLIDDVDQAAITKQNSYDYSVCWAIVAATIQLANDFSEVRSLISVRTDIWHTMTVGKKHGSDILDKIQTPVYLRFTEEELGEVFFKRIELANKEAIGSYKRDLSTFFERRTLKLPGNTESIRSWDFWIRKQSRNRPRDMVQLVQQLIEKAEDHGNGVIKAEDAYQIMLDYARERITNIEREYREICPQIKAIIRELSTEKMYDFSELVKILKAVPSSRRVVIDSTALTPDTNDAAIKILHVLHMCNFINARVEAENQESDYDHILFSQRPDLVSADNWNELQKYRWEIHPVFHPYIHEMKTSTYKF